jgi:hypothetical protein
LDWPPEEVMQMADLKWNKDRLYRLVQEKLGDYLFLVVSNKEGIYEENIDGLDSWVF